MSEGNIVLGNSNGLWSRGMSQRLDGATGMCVRLNYATRKCLCPRTENATEKCWCLNYANGKCSRETLSGSERSAKRSLAKAKRGRPHHLQKMFGDEFKATLPPPPGTP